MPKQKQTKQCAIYTRVSTDAQAEKDFSSCESQEEKVRTFIQSQNDWHVAKVYTDAGFTGANTKRPALQELLEDIKQNKIDIVLSYKIDRLTRSPKDFYQLIEFFEQNNVSFISTTERFDTSTPSGRLLRNIMLTFAQFERELASERTKDKLVERAKKGFFNGGVVPFGYQRKDKKLIIVKKQAEIIKLIFETYLKNSSVDEVYQLLKIKDIKTRQGNNFTKGLLARVLRNPIYAGKIKYSGNLYQGIHKPIISEELFELAQNAHKKRIRKYRIYRKFLLGGLIKCNECGSFMSPCFTNKHKKGKLKRYYYYRCTSTSKKSWGHCPLKEVPADRIEQYLLENLERISMDNNYIEMLALKLNQGLNTTPCVGSEPTKVCSKFSGFEPAKITSLLKSFMGELKDKKGIERNLLAKKFVQKILYSKQSIKIALFYPIRNKVSIENPVDFQKIKKIGGGKDTALLVQGGVEIFSETRVSSHSKGLAVPADPTASEKQWFVSNSLGGRNNEFQTFNIILPNLIHKSRKKNLN